MADETQPKPQSSSDAELLRLWADIYATRERLGWFARKPPRLYVACYGRNWELISPAARDNFIHAVCLSDGNRAQLDAYQLINVSLARP